VFALALVALVTIGVRRWWPEGDRFDTDAGRLDQLQGRALQLAEAGDDGWPQWLGPARNGVAPGSNVNPWPESGPTRVWEAPLGGGFGSPVVSGGKVYLLTQEGPNEVIRCLDDATGEQRWQHSYAARFESDQGSGPRASPALSGGRLFTVGGTGIMHCLDATSGNVIWSKDLMQEFAAQPPRWGVSFSPLVDGERVYVQPGGRNGNSVAALDVASGNVLWKSLDDGPSYSSPVIGSPGGMRQVLFFTAKGLVSLTPDGRLLWRYPWATAHEVNAATPLVINDYVFISSSYGKGCALLEVHKEGDTLAARKVYDSNRMKNHWATCVFHDDHLYGFDDGMLTCLSLKTGAVKWKERKFARGTVIRRDSTLIVLGEHGNLALVKATPDGYQELAHAPVLGNRCWTVPVLTDGRLYARDETKLLCLDVGK
jgi:outer membrane protein assembly factor BamB